MGRAAVGQSVVNVPQLVLVGDVGFQARELDAHVPAAQIDLGKFDEPLS